MQAVFAKSLKDPVSHSKLEALAIKLNFKLTKNLLIRVPVLIDFLFEFAFQLSKIANSPLITPRGKSSSNVPKYTIIVNQQGLTFL